MSVTLMLGPATGRQMVPSIVTRHCGQRTDLCVGGPISASGRRCTSTPAASALLFGASEPFISSTEMLPTPTDTVRVSLRLRFVLQIVNTEQLGLTEFTVEKYPSDASVESVKRNDKTECNGGARRGWHRAGPRAAAVVTRGAAWL